MYHKCTNKQWVTRLKLFDAEADHILVSPSLRMHSMSPVRRSVICFMVDMSLRSSNRSASSDTRTPIPITRSPTSAEVWFEPVIRHLTRNRTCCLYGLGVLRCRPVIELGNYHGNGRYPIVVNIWWTSHSRRTGRNKGVMALLTPLAILFLISRCLVAERLLYVH